MTGGSGVLPVRWCFSRVVVPRPSSPCEVRGVRAAVARQDREASRCQLDSLHSQARCFLASAGRAPPWAVSAAGGPGAEDALCPSWRRVPLPSGEQRTCFEPIDLPLPSPAWALLVSQMWKRGEDVSALQLPEMAFQIVQSSSCTPVWFFLTRLSVLPSFVSSLYLPLLPPIHPSVHPPGLLHGSRLGLDVLIVQCCSYL